MLVVREVGPDEGAPLPPLQEVEEGAAGTVESRRYSHLQVSELFSMEKCNQAVIDFLAVTEVGKFPRR